MHNAQPHKKECPCDVWDAATVDQRKEIYLLDPESEYINQPYNELPSMVQQHIMEGIEFKAKGGLIFESGGQIPASKKTYPSLENVKPLILNDAELKEKVPEVELRKIRTFEYKGDDKITSSYDAASVFRQYWDRNAIAIQEHFNVMFLNRGNKVIYISQLSKGGISSTVVDVQLVSAMAVKSLAVGVIMAHNHPSGTVTPSQADKSISDKLKKALALFNITLLDSMIITENDGYYSFADNGEI